MSDSYPGASQREHSHPTLLLVTVFVLGCYRQQPPSKHTAAHITHAISVKALRIHGFPLTCFYTDITVPLLFQLTSSTTHRVFAIVAQIVASNMHRYELPVSTEVNSLCNKKKKITSLNFFDFVTCMWYRCRWIYHVMQHLFLFML